MDTAVLRQDHWDEQYRFGNLPWDTGRPSSELQRILARHCIQPCKAIEIGCGTGSDAVYMASRGFQVTAIDLSPVAIRRAEHRAWAAGVAVDFIVGDVTDRALLAGQFDFFYDRGCYHAVRMADSRGYLRTVKNITRTGALGLVLLGNASEPEEEVGPPVLAEWEVHAEWGRGFEILDLRSFRFDPRCDGEKRYLGWSCLLRK